MTNLEYIIKCTKNPQQLAAFLDSWYGLDDAPWNTWFNKNYCGKCEPVKIKLPEEYHSFYPDRLCDAAPCELKDPETGEYDNPCGFAHCDTVKIIEAWFAAEYEGEQ